MFIKKIFFYNFFVNQPVFLLTLKHFILFYKEVNDAFKYQSFVTLEYKNNSNYLLATVGNTIN